jgi:alpha-ribazole phosphatase/probable phosphoglycerate mutase
MRHGETEWNRARRVMGHLPIPLAAEGIAQSRAAVHFLRSLGIGRIVSSPLARARETAEILARELDLKVDEDAGLCEVDFGAWAGQGYDELLGRPDYEAYAVDPVRVAPPGGEALLAVQQRGVAAVGRMLAGGPTAPVLAVSHGDLIRAVLCELLAIDLAEFRRFRVDNCSLSAANILDGGTRVWFVNLLPDPVGVWRLGAGDLGRREL